ncbi:hypothetical protein [Shimia sediminis]|uniref:hypothetical protein n=1 Tax=Shimia sediminis TaxID=2497945 RepID=UPI000F8D60BE|nr:hypothetical protein [Shimia sediminis]
MNIAVNQRAVGQTAAMAKARDAAAGAFSMRERDGYFRHTSRNEAVIRFIGIAIVLGAFVQWLTPNSSFVGDANLAKTGLSIAFSTIGIAIYTHAMRGHRIEVAFNPRKMEINIAKLDRRDGVRSKRTIPLRNIKSIYVHKGEGIGTPSKMRIKLYDSPSEITAVRGAYEEIELAHRQLCRSIRIAQG